LLFIVHLNGNEMKKSVLMLILVMSVALMNTSVVFSQIANEVEELKYGDKLYSEGLFDLALIQYRAFTEKYPASVDAPKALFRTAESLFQLGNYKEARKEYFNLTIKYQASQFVNRCQLLIALCLEKEGEIEQAAKFYHRYYIYNPESAEARQSLFDAASIYVSINKFKIAESCFNTLKMSKKDQFSSMASFGLLALFLNQYRYAEVEKMANLIISAPVLNDDKRKAQLILANLYRIQARWEDAKEMYTSLKVWIPLAEVQILTGEYTKAHSSLKLAILDNDSEIKLKARLLKGEIFLKENLPAEALKQFNIAASIAKDSPHFFKVRYKQALANYLNSDYSKACDLFQKLIMIPDCPQRILQLAILHGSDAAMKFARYDVARKFLDMYLNKFPSDKMIPLVLLRKGRLVFKSGGYLEEGFVALREHLSTYPVHETNLEARFVLAHGLADAGRIEEAGYLFKGIASAAPWSKWAKKSKSKLDSLDLQNPVNIAQNLTSMSRLVQESLRKPDNSHLLFELGNLAFFKMKQYEDAIYYYQLFNAKTTVQVAGTELSEYRIAFCKEGLYRQNRDEVIKDGAIAAYTKFIKDFPDSKLRPKAEQSIIELGHSTDLTGYLNLMQKYPSAEIIFETAQKYEEADSSVKSLDLYTRLYHSYPHHILAEQAFCKIIVASYLSKSMQYADSLSQLYTETYASGKFLPDIYFERAMAIRTNQPETAVNMLEGVLRKFPNYRKDRVMLSLIDLYFQTKQYKKVIISTKTALETDSIKTLANRTGFYNGYHSNKDILLQYLLTARKKTNNLKAAKKVAYKLLKLDHEVNKQADIYLQLADINRLQNNAKQSEIYLSLAAKSLNSDSLALELGRLRLKLDLFDQARKAFSQAEKMASEKSKKAACLAGIVTTLYRQGNIKTAGVRLNLLRNTYKKESNFKLLMSQLELEKGKALAARKDFAEAVSVFKDCIKSAPDIVTPYAELELGKSLLKSNLIDKALPLLTALPKKYPDHKILAEVYFYLGTHYANSHQNTNAAITFRKAINIKGNYKIKKDAYKRLIKSQTDQGLYDGAMASAREYMSEFPDSDDLLDTREDIGSFYMELHDYTRAIEVFKDLLPFTSTQQNVDIQLKLGQCYDSMGLFQEAVFEYLKVVYLGRPTNSLPWKATALYSAGLAYEKMNELLKARRMYEMIVKRKGRGSRFGKFAIEKINKINLIIHNSDLNP